MCLQEGCKKKGIYNFLGADGRYCSEHRLEGMVDVMNKRCEHPDCVKQPAYNLPGETKRRFCAEHKLEGMVNVISKKCEHQDCSKIPHYNLPGETKARYCSEHKLEGMVDIKNKKCEHLGCVKQPIYNLPGKTQAKFCSEHKLEGMVNVKSKRCEHLGCETRPNYNSPGETKARFCAEHKLEGMVDIKSKRCEHLGCETRPIYNLPGETKRRFCAEHKLEGMVNVASKRCEHPDCKTRPNYNLPGETRGRFCNEHKLEGMVNVISKMCKTPLCDTFITHKYRGYCLRCFIHTFPNEPVTRNYKTKEIATVEKIREEFEERVDLTTDKIVADGCSKRRPDCYIDLGYQVIIIEIDENQHTDYDCSCENKRTMELSRDFDHRPIVFIRFNPDKYIRDGKVITSCWGTNKNGITTVKKSKVKEWNTRLNTLIDTIKYWIEPENKTSKTIEVIQLYYDDND